MAAEAITQIAQVFCDRSTLAFEELEATHSDEGRVMPSDAFDRYVRQSMEVDFDQFMATLVGLPRKPPERQSLADEPDSIVGTLDQVALLQALDQQMNQQPGLTELEAFNQAIGVAHEEDVAAWSTAITQWLQLHQKESVSLCSCSDQRGCPSFNCG